MNNLPITSRIKRSPLLQTTDYIDPETKNVVTAGGIVKGPDTVKTETKTKDYNKNWDKKAAGGLSYAEWIKLPGNKEKERKFVEKQTETTTTTTPGETTVWEEPLKVQTTGDVFQPWETRQMSRSIKKEERDKRRAKIKAAKAKGILTPELRKQYKAEEAEAEGLEMEALSKRNKAARASGKRTGTSDVVTGERDMRLSDVGDKTAQEIYLKDKNEREIAKKDNVVIADENKDSGVKMNPSAFKMYAKSPATKKLQGNQGKLPMHLQEAIKAAPGKMKSALKKNYFKK